MNDLNQIWQRYDERVIPRDAPPAHHIECRRAYFHGAHAVLELIAKLEDVSPLQRAREIEAMRTEVRQFRLDVAADRA
jgi:hypothetical protein